jgi:hypothetical protein
MTKIYAIFAVAGWVWALIFFAFLAIKLRKEKNVR